MAGAAHAAGAASIAARGISVTKEIIIATGLGLAAGGVFKARTRAVSAPQTGQPADVGAAVVEGARVVGSRLLSAPSSLWGPARGSRWSAGGLPPLRRERFPPWPPCPHSPPHACLFADTATGLALELAAQGGAALRGPGQGQVRRNAARFAGKTPERHVRFHLWARLGFTPSRRRVTCAPAATTWLADCET
jgi:hypothetical protein